MDRNPGNHLHGSRVTDKQDNAISSKRSTEEGVDNDDFPPSLLMTGIEDFRRAAQGIQSLINQSSQPTSQHSHSEVQVRGNDISQEYAEHSTSVHGVSQRISSPLLSLPSAPGADPLQGLVDAATGTAMSAPAANQKRAIPSMTAESQCTPAVDDVHKKRKRPSGESCRERILGAARVVSDVLHLQSRYSLSREDVAESVGVSLGTWRAVAVLTTLPSGAVQTRMEQWCKQQLEQNNDSPPSYTAMPCPPAPMDGRGYWPHLERLITLLDRVKQTFADAHDRTTAVQSLVDITGISRRAVLNWFSLSALPGKQHWGLLDSWCDQFCDGRVPSAAELGANAVGGVTEQRPQAQSGASSATQSDQQVEGSGIHNASVAAARTILAATQGQAESTGAMKPAGTHGHPTSPSLSSSEMTQLLSHPVSVTWLKLLGRDLASLSEAKKSRGPRGGKVKKASAGKEPSGRVRRSGDTSSSLAGKDSSDTRSALQVWAAAVVAATSSFQQPPPAFPTQEIMQQATAVAGVLHSVRNNQHTSKEQLAENTGHLAQQSAPSSHASLGSQPQFADSQSSQAVSRIDSEEGMIRMSHHNTHAQAAHVDAHKLPAEHSFQDNPSLDHGHSGGTIDAEFQQSAHLGAGLRSAHSQRKPNQSIDADLVTGQVVREPSASRHVQWHGHGEMASAAMFVREVQQDGPNSHNDTHSALNFDRGIRHEGPLPTDPAGGSMSYVEQHCSTIQPSHGFAEQQGALMHAQAPVMQSNADANASMLHGGQGHMLTSSRTLVHPDALQMPDHCDTIHVPGQQQLELDGQRYTRPCDQEYRQDHDNSSLNVCDAPSQARTSDGVSGIPSSNVSSEQVQSMVDSASLCQHGSVDGHSSAVPHTQVEMHLRQQ